MVWGSETAWGTIVRNNNVPGDEPESYGMELKAVEQFPLALKTSGL